MILDAILVGISGLRQDTLYELRQRDEIQLDREEVDM
jgi:hypothetical protein